MTEYGLALLKPDAVNRRLVGLIVTEYEKLGMTLVDCRLLTLTQDQATYLYIEHSNKSVFSQLIEYISSGPSVALLLNGKNAASRLRNIHGKADPAMAAIGTIRNKYGISYIENTVHSSDSTENVYREAEILFGYLPKKP